MNKSARRGFTIIELVLVTVVIGILAALVITTRAGVQQNRRDSERQHDIKELRNGLEGYFAQANRYPTLKDLNSAQWRASHMRSVDPAAFRDPSDKNQGIGEFAAKPTRQAYAYTVTSASGSDCGSDKNPCTQYTLTATMEVGGVFVKNNLN